MLRHFTAKAIARQQQQQQQQYPLLWRRSYAAAAATSRQKRSLDKQQIQGTKASAPAAAPVSAAAPASSAPSPSPAASGGGSGGAPASGSGGGSGALFGIVAAVGAGGALAYYNGIFDAAKEEEAKPKTAAAVEEEEAPKKEEEQTQVPDIIEEDKSAIVDKADSPGPAEEEEVVVVEDPEPIPVVTHKEKATDTPEGGPEAVVAAVEESPAPVAPILQESKIMEELEKVKAQLSKESDKALTQAHSELAKLSILNLDNLDDMTNTQLKVRIVQMAKDMEDRTKWEAVRLQEFLGMKEKEVEDKYVCANCCRWICVPLVDLRCISLTRFPSCHT